MTNPYSSHRRAVLTAARAVLEGKNGPGDFLALVEKSDYADPLLAEVIERISHLPSSSRIFGIGREKYAQQIDFVRRLIDAAERGA